MRVITLTDAEAAWFRALGERDMANTRAHLDDLRDKGHPPASLAYLESRIALARSAVKNLAQNAPRTAEQQAAGLDSSGKPEGVRGGN